MRPRVAHASPGHGGASAPAHLLLVPLLALCAAAAAAQRARLVLCRREPRRRSLLLPQGGMRGRCRGRALCMSASHAVHSATACRPLPRAACGARCVCPPAATRRPPAAAPCLPAAAQSGVRRPPAAARGPRAPRARLAACRAARPRARPFPCSAALGPGRGRGAQAGGMARAEGAQSAALSERQRQRSAALDLRASRRRRIWPCLPREDASKCTILRSHRVLPLGRLPLALQELLPSRGMPQPLYERLHVQKLVVLDAMR